MNNLNLIGSTVRLINSNEVKKISDYETILDKEIFYMTDNTSYCKDQLIFIDEFESTLHDISQYIINTDQDVLGINDVAERFVTVLSPYSTKITQVKETKPKKSIVTKFFDFWKSLW